MPDQATPNDEPVLAPRVAGDTVSRDKHDRIVAALNTQIRMRDGDLTAAQTDIERLTKDLTANREIIEAGGKVIQERGREIVNLRATIASLEEQVAQLRRQAAADTADLEEQVQQLKDGQDIIGARFAHADEQLRLARQRILDLEAALRHAAEEREVLAEKANGRLDGWQAEYRYQHTLRIVNALAEDGSNSLINLEDKEAVELALADIRMAVQQRLVAEKDGGR